MADIYRNNEWTSYAGRIVLNTASHPIEYAKILIQIGFEPIPPRPCTTFWGKPVLKLPNIFSYIKHIKKVDGFTGLYRGLLPKLCGNIVCGVTTDKILKKYDGEVEEQSEDERLNRQAPAKKRYLHDLKRDIISRTGAIIVSHPFHVITIRMMAQFVGNETKYNSLFSSVSEIYKQNGILGFFSGLVPRIVGDILFVILGTTMSYVVNAYIFELDIQIYANATASFVASAITYPFQVVSNCMAVSNSGLAAGSMPLMPYYTSWVDCWSDLWARNQLKRGSSLLSRYYTGPQMIVSGRAVPILKNDVNLSM